jgi:parvulin-like peptidyl-prolyl isomerase
VGFGVILFGYQGAQLADKNAPTKAFALQRATEALKEARRDFEGAVKRGDRGSTADAGQIQRGILEPALEYALFTLPVGTVHRVPIDTPRGYWLVRRND